MNSTLPPQAWRSEAFAEDLTDEAVPPPRAPEHGGATLWMLWGVLPALVAVAAATGAAVMAWSGA